MFIANTNIYNYCKTWDSNQLLEGYQYQSECDAGAQEEVRVVIAISAYFSEQDVMSNLNNCHELLSTEILKSVAHILKLFSMSFQALSLKFGNNVAP